MRSIAWRLYLGTGALATGTYYLLPKAGGARPERGGRRLGGGRDRHRDPLAPAGSVAGLTVTMAADTLFSGLRELMASLRPPTLDEVGLEAARRC
jgi:hypothetical protein